MILVILAQGFEEMEAISVVDILRRADLDVRTVSITDQKTVYGSHNIPVIADMLFNEIDIKETDALILPGGMPGTENLKMHEGLKMLLMTFLKDENKTVADICAAPTILGELGLLKGRKVTCYPGCEESLYDAKISRRPAIRDRNLITGDGPGHAQQFALKVLEYLGNAIVAADITKQLNM